VNVLADVYPERHFGGFSAVDGTIAFYGRVQSLLNAKSVVLDFGCGRGEHQGDSVSFRRDARLLRSRAGHVIGADVCEEARTNPFIDEFLQLPGDGSIPLSSASIDLMVADWVMEHLEDIPLFFAEAHRVIKPGGMLCIRTLNQWSYVGIASRAIPNRFHSSVLQLLQPRREDRDIFPTHYRCNSTGKLRRAFRAANFKAVVFGHEAEPSYLQAFPVLYRFCASMHKHIPRALASAIFAFGERLDGPSDQIFRLDDRRR
jgi:SAM-dependent methyltransferase